MEFYLHCQTSSLNRPSSPSEIKQKMGESSLGIGHVVCGGGGGGVVGVGGGAGTRPSGKIEYI